MFQDIEDQPCDLPIQKVLKPNSSRPVKQRNRHGQDTKAVNKKEYVDSNAEELPLVTFPFWIILYENTKESHPNCQLSTEMMPFFLLSRMISLLKMIFQICHHGRNKEILKICPENMNIQERKKTNNMLTIALGKINFDMGNLLLVLKCCPQSGIPLPIHLPTETFSLLISVRDMVLQPHKCAYHPAGKLPVIDRVIR